MSLETNVKRLKRDKRLILSVLFRISAIVRGGLKSFRGTNKVDYIILIGFVRFRTVIRTFTRACVFSGARDTKSTAIK